MLKRSPNYGVWYCSPFFQKTTGCPPSRPPTLTEVRRGSRTRRDSNAWCIVLSKGGRRRGPPSHGGSEPASRPHPPASPHGLAGDVSRKPGIAATFRSEKPGTWAGAVGADGARELTRAVVMAVTAVGRDKGAWRPARTPLRQELRRQRLGETRSEAQERPAAKGL